jgi:hypothetical protein
VIPAERGGRWPVAAPLDLTPTILGRPAPVTGHGELLDQQPPAFASGTGRSGVSLDALDAALDRIDAETIE